MNHPFKIALVSAFDYSFHGGVADHIRGLAAQFNNWGHSVRVIAPCSAPERITDDNFIPMGKPVPLPSGGSIARISLSVWLRPRIKSLLRDENFDIIHLHEPFAGVVPVNVLSLSKAVNIATFHTYMGTRLYKLGGSKLARRYFRKIHGHIAVSEPARQFINQYFPANYKVIPNGINLDNFNNGGEGFPYLRDGMTNILFVGRLEKRKGLKYLLAAYNILKPKWPNIRLLVVGPGDLDRESNKLIKDGQMKDVIFTGPVSDTDKIRYYKSADIFCSPATGRESFGIVLLEAMASGTPIVASAIEGYSSVINQGSDGLLVEPRNKYDLANHIEVLLKNPDLRASLASNGLNKAKEFRWERVAGEIIEYYENCMAHNRS